MLDTAVGVHFFPAEATVDAQLRGDLPFIGGIEGVGGLFAGGVFPLVAVAPDAVVGQGLDRGAAGIDRHQIEQAGIVLHVGQVVGRIAAESFVDMGEVITHGEIMRLRTGGEAVRQLVVADEFLHRHGDAAQAGDDDIAVAILMSGIEDL